MSEKTFSEKIILKTMNWVYDKSLHGVGKVQSAEELALEYIAGYTSKKKAVQKLIHHQELKAGSTGFIAGLPGLLATPVTIPANITGVMFLQIRLISAIAVIGGYDLENEKVKELIFLCLAGNSAADVLKDATLSIEKRVAEKFLQSISTKSINSFQQKAGFKIAQSLSPKLITNFSKALPLVSGVIGGIYDYRQTHSIAKLAKETFID